MFVSVLPMAELPDGTTRRVSLGRLRGRVLLSRYGDHVIAVSDRCPHLGWRLPATQVGGVMTCPFHGAQFDLESGRVVRPPLSTEWSAQLPRGVGQAVTALLPERPCPPLTRYPTQVVDGQVQVDLDAVLTAPAIGGDERLSPVPDGPAAGGLT